MSMKAETPVFEPGQIPESVVRLKEKLKNRDPDFLLLFDGAMGTMVQERCGHETSPEALLQTEPEKVEEIHLEYLQAGAAAIKTATFSVSSLLEENRPQEAEAVLSSAVRAAKNAVERSGRKNLLIFGDIGPVSEACPDPAAVYISQMKQFLSEGVFCFLMETLVDPAGLKEAVRWLSKQAPFAVLIVSFAVGMDSMSTAGFSARELLAFASETGGIDAAGFNCVMGPHHHLKQLDNLKWEKEISVMPNAGYPVILGRKIHYEGSAEYFALQMEQAARKGVRILGGCCGTTPDHIRTLRRQLDQLDQEDLYQSGKAENEKREPAEFSDSLWHAFEQKTYPVFTELDPPANDRIASFMQSVGRYKEAGADVITIADCPIGRPRADSSLLACKVKRETGMNVLPHMTCRDRNLNAAKALLMGLAIEDVHNVLLVTGDPLPADLKEEVRSVFSFNSRKLARFVSQINEESLSAPIRTFGALNINARNFDVQLRLAREKEENGMAGFLTQPVLSEQGLENLKRARKELNGKILGGLFPIVSWKNGQFLKNEISGMDVADEILVLYEGKNREEGEETAKKVTLAIAEEMKDYVDGFYVMTPFQRVDLVSSIVSSLKEMEKM